MTPSELADLLSILRAHGVARYECRADGSYVVDLLAATPASTQDVAAPPAPQSDGIDPFDALAAARSKAAE